MNDGGPTLVKRDSHILEGPLVFDYSTTAGTNWLNPSGDWYDFYTNTEPVKCPTKYTCATMFWNSSILTNGRNIASYYGIAI